jgi:hypothetical protein
MLRAQPSGEEQFHVRWQVEGHFAAFNARARLPVLDSMSMVFASVPTTMTVSRCALDTVRSCRAVPVCSAVDGGTGFRGLQHLFGFLRSTGF